MREFKIEEIENLGEAVSELLKTTGEFTPDEVETIEPFYSDEMQEDLILLTLSDGSEYLIATEYGADQYATERIKTDLWAFNADFIADHCDALNNVYASEWDHVIKAIKLMQSELCESAGPIVSALIGDNMEQFIENAIDADGRGHFISYYDGEEIELKNGFYAYRMN